MEKEKAKKFLLEEIHAKHAAMPSKTYVSSSIVSTPFTEVGWREKMEKTSHSRVSESKPLIPF